ncbi:MAG: hypothetical protein ACLP9C_02030 [Acidimicrobiales bacterium]
MERKRPRLIAGAVAAVAALSLAACGGLGSARVIGPGATTTSSPPPATGPTSNTAQPSTPSTTPPPSTTAPPTTTTAPGGVDPGTVAQIDAQLNALNAAMNQAQGDLSSPNPGDR